MVARDEVADADAVERSVRLFGRRADVVRGAGEQRELPAGEDLRVGHDDEAVARPVRGLAPQLEVVAAARVVHGEKEPHDVLLDGRVVAGGRGEIDEAGVLRPGQREASPGVGPDAVRAVGHDDAFHAPALAADRAAADPLPGAGREDREDREQRPCDQCDSFHGPIRFFGP